MNALQAADALEAEYLKVANGEIKPAKMSLEPLVKAVQALRAFAKPAALTDEQKETVFNAVAEALGDAYDCDRVWSAWSVGTMRQDDFYPVADSPERVADIANAALEALAKATGTA